VNKHINTGAPKKARWSTAKKIDAKTGPKKAHRGQQATRGFDDRTPRTSDRRDDRAPRAYGNDRPARTYDARGDRTPRTSDRRDDRAPRAYGNDRPARPYDARDDRTPRSSDRRDDRAPRTYGSDRPARTYEKREPGAPRSDFKRDENYGKRTDRPARTYEKRTPTPAVDTKPVTIAEDNGFAALRLPAVLVERLARDGITTPFPIQTATIPDALAGRDVLGRGQTGSGKTFAFGLPTLTRLAAGDRALARRPRALILTPTRELAMQISDALEPFVHVMGLRHKLVAGGMPYPPQLMALDRGVELLIATPGRLNDLIERGAVQLTDIAIMILDEADHMADMGFLPEITAILDGLPENGQRLLFSATLDHGVDEVVERYLTDAVTHSTDDATASVTTMEHHILLIDPKHKKSITAEVANRQGRTLVFVRTKLGADRVAEQLRDQGVFAAALHGGLNQGARNRVLAAFRQGSLPVLVATDVAARGIHVDDVSVVLQADPPADHKDYLHRSGRTARAGEKGTVVTLALPHQRRGMERMAREAGVDVVATRAVPGDALLTSTGACKPSGVPIPESQARRLLEGEQRGHRRPFGGGGRGGQGGGPRRNNDGPRGYRGSRG
jgi:superfamily II DNA/RNA helicase